MLTHEIFFGRKYDNGKYKLLGETKCQTYSCFWLAVTDFEKTMDIHFHSPASPPSEEIKESVKRFVMNERIAVIVGVYPVGVYPMLEYI